MAATGSSFDVALFDARIKTSTLEPTTRPSFYSDLTQKMNGNDRNRFPDPTTIRTHRYVGFGPMERVYEEEAFPYDTPARGPTKTTTYKKWGKAIGFTEEFQEDTLMSVAEDLANSLGESDPLNKDITVAELFDNFFATTYYTAPDGKALGATDHLSYKGGGSRKNILATSSASSYTSFQDLFTAMLRQVDDLGYPRPAVKLDDTVTILHQPEDTWVLERLLGEKSEYEPETDNNAGNVLKRFKYRFVCNPFQTGTGTQTARYWFVLISPKGGDGDLWMVEKKAPTTDTYMQRPMMNIVHTLRSRWAIHVYDWTHMYGSGN